MRILLVDDHPFFLKGLKAFLSIRGIEVVGTARDGIEALEKARALQPEVILMDIRMMQLNGLAVTRLIKTEQPNVKIVMLTMSRDDEDLFEAINSGACGAHSKVCAVFMTLAMACPTCASATSRSGSAEAPLRLTFKP